MVSQEKNALSECYRASSGQKRLNGPTCAFWDSYHYDHWGFSTRVAFWKCLSSGTPCSFHAIQRSWPRALCWLVCWLIGSLMCCRLVVLLLWPKSLCWSWCQYTTDADAEEDLMLLWCWCWGSGWSCHLLTSAWPLSKARNVAALDSNVTDFHTWLRLPDDPDDLMVLRRLVTWLMILNTWWCCSPDDEA